ncbi:MAG: DUF2330 domain-containing protein [Deltaproteobacteria bacterium]|nr:DUF2330 domain-containing protein [Deltaproteobacteria bacterium]
MSRSTLPLPFSPAIVAAGVGFGLALAAPSLALACGGLFCNGASPIPVEQSGERILFEVDPIDLTVTTTVDIQFQGDPDAFSWILPIPVTDAMPVPDLALAPESLLRDLEIATQPSMVPPPTKCTAAPQPPGVFNDSSLSAGESAQDDGGVDVTDLPNVGPFDNELIQAGSADALITWLTENGYLVSPAMEPALADYVGEGLAFLGVKLLADADVSEIAPLSITWPGSEPMIPLRLTSISAEPDMGLLVFVAADSAYESENWTTMELDRERLQWNPVRNQSNYQGLLSFQLDEVGGQGFVVERADATDLVVPNGASSEELSQLFARRDVITRLHGRAHPEEMVSDPVFTPAAALAFDGVFDLSDRPAIEACQGANRNPVACGTTYCGVGGVCATTDAGIDGCVCEEGFSAREVMSPTRPGQPESATVVCQDSSVDFLAELGPSEADVCSNTDCGPAGSCTAVNGFATCSCDDGFAAVPMGDGSPICSAVDTAYPAERIGDWQVAGCSGGCDAAGGAGQGASLLALMGLLLGLTRRRV